MTPQPTGTLEATDRGANLIIRRIYTGTLEDVWQSVTASESTARWIGPWHGDAAPGKTVVLTMSYEEGAPPCDVTITACEPPRHLAVSTNDASGQWRLELFLEPVEGAVAVTFVQHLENLELVGEVGPGWEYYLDMLGASRLGAPRPQFEHYYPAQKKYYLDALKAVTASSSSETLPTAARGVEARPKRLRGS